MTIYKPESRIRIPGAFIRELIKQTMPPEKTVRLESFTQLGDSGGGTFIMGSEKVTFNEGAQLIAQQAPTPLPQKAPPSGLLKAVLKRAEPSGE